MLSYLLAERLCVGTDTLLIHCEVARRMGTLKHGF